MAVPWLQIVQLVPSIVDVSRELLKKNKQHPSPPPNTPQSNTELLERIAALEENERKQAELVSRMAEQLSLLTKMAVELRTRVLWLIGATVLSALLAIIAIVVAAS